MKYEYLKGSAKDFEGRFDCYCTIYRCHGGVSKHSSARGSVELIEILGHLVEIIAERRPITDESDLNECIGQAVDRVSGFYAQELSERCLDKMMGIGQPLSDFGAVKDEEFIDDFVTFGKYDRQCKGVVIDVYDVLQAFEVINPALQHLVKKALCAGLRGHKKREQDLVEILESAKRAIELEGK
ncbi:MAG: hypothetical protein [Bacteriophage sp.]|nr:MAG: hypothetical protein [Bacteriophage sp.]